MTRSKYAIRPVPDHPLTRPPVSAYDLAVRLPKMTMTGTLTCQVRILKMVSEQCLWQTAAKATSSSAYVIMLLSTPKSITSSTPSKQRVSRTENCSLSLVSSTLSWKLGKTQYLSTFVPSMSSQRCHHNLSSTSSYSIFPTTTVLLPSTDDLYIMATGLLDYRISQLKV